MKRIVIRNDMAEVRELERLIAALGPAETRPEIVYTLDWHRARLDVKGAGAIVVVCPTVLDQSIILVRDYVKAANSEVLFVEDMLHGGSSGKMDAKVPRLYRTYLGLTSNRWLLALLLAEPLDPATTTPASLQALVDTLTQRLEAAAA